MIWWSHNTWGLTPGKASELSEADSELCVCSCDSEVILPDKEPIKPKTRTAASPAIREGDFGGLWEYSPSPWKQLPTNIYATVLLSSSVKIFHLNVLPGVVLHVSKSNPLSGFLLVLYTKKRQKSMEKLLFLFLGTTERHFYWCLTLPPCSPLVSAEISLELGENGSWRRQGGW